MQPTTSARSTKAKITLKTASRLSKKRPRSASDYYDNTVTIVARQAGDSGEGERLAALDTTKHQTSSRRIMAAWVCTATEDVLTIDEQIMHTSWREIFRSSNSVHKV